MDREETAAAIKVMQHYVDGGEVEVSAHGYWSRIPDEGQPNWMWGRCSFRRTGDQPWWTICDGDCAIDKFMGSREFALKRLEARKANITVRPDE